MLITLKLVEKHLAQIFREHNQIRLNSEDWIVHLRWLFIESGCLNARSWVRCECSTKGASQQIIDLHLTSNPWIHLHSMPTTLMSFLTSSMNLIFGLPQRLFQWQLQRPFTIIIPVPFLNWSKPTHSASLYLSPGHLPWAVPLTDYLLILSVPISPKENLNIFSEFSQLSESSVNTATFLNIFKLLKNRMTFNPFSMLQEKHA